MTTKIKSKLSKDDRSLLHRAITLAKNRGRCSYSSGCVIAQLAMLCGLSKETVSNWDDPLHEHPMKTSIGELRNRNVPGIEALDRFPIELLKELQEAWDSWDAKSQGDSRDSLHRMIR